MIIFISNDTFDSISTAGIKLSTGFSTNIVLGKYSTSQKLLELQLGQSNLT